MAKKVKHVVPYRRKREGKTNYKKRLKILVSNKPRLIIRKSNKNIIAQIAEYKPEGDKLIISVSSRLLEKEYGWKINKGNIPSAYLTGLLLGKKALKKGVKQAVLDIGLNSSVKGSRIYAALKGACDAGLDIPHSNDNLPKEDSISGRNIVKYAQKLEKEDKQKYEKSFSSYLKNKININDIAKIFEDTKSKLLKG